MVQLFYHNKRNFELFHFITYRMHGKTKEVKELRQKLIERE